jgi:hypothetical protein
MRFRLFRGRDPVGEEVADRALTVQRRQALVQPVLHLADLGLHAGVVGGVDDLAPTLAVDLGQLDRGGPHPVGPAVQAALTARAPPALRARALGPAHRDVWHAAVRGAHHARSMTLGGATSRTGSWLQVSPERDGKQALHVDDLRFRVLPRLDLNQKPCD